VVDAIQGGAGTSTNMNANEVIANLALELIGRAKGDYAAIHPNNDVNMAQSTNDAYPTALRLAIILASAPLVRALEDLAYALKGKAVEFGHVLKMGRTQPWARSSTLFTLRSRRTSPGSGRSSACSAK
jgi:aspartate ammonia-lyase